jgi:hypothetical protein
VRIAVCVLAAAAALVVAGAGTAAQGELCSGQAARCGFMVSSSGFKAFGAGADGRTLNARVGAAVLWKLELGELGRGRAHTISSNDGFFRSPLLSNRVGHAVYWRRHVSAGRFGFHDSVNGAGGGMVVVLPSVQRVPAGLKFTWATPLSTFGNAYAVRFEVLDELDTAGKGWVFGHTATRSYTFHTGYRLGTTLLAKGRILCVEVRTGLLGEGWSDWAKNCATL